VSEIPTEPHVFESIVYFDTGQPSNPYSIIFGTHNGAIKPNQTITAGIYNDSWSTVTLPWEGYGGNWHNPSFTETFKLYADVEYNFTIKTGSYPQIIMQTNLMQQGER